MGLANVLLVRYASGFAEVVDAASVAANGRQEAFLSLGQTEDLTEATRIGEATLALVGQPRVHTTVEVEPVDATEEPYSAYGVGDSLSVPNEAGTPETVKVRAVTVTEDTEGFVTFVPEVRDVLDDAEAALGRWLKRMAHGTLGGVSQTASPVDNAASSGIPGDRSEWTYPWGQGGALTASRSGDWPVDRPGTLVLVEITLTAAGSTASTFVVLRNGVALAQTITLNAGETRTTQAFNEPFDAGDLIGFQSSTAGTGAGIPFAALHMRAA